MSKRSDEEKLAKWLENPDTPAPDFDDEKWQARHNTATFIQHQAEMMTDHEVPNWDSGQTFEQEKTPWWQWSGLNLLSTGLSVLAIGMVLFNVEVKMNDDGMLVSFGHTDSALQSHLIAQQVDEKISAFEQQQAVKLVEFTRDLQSAQYDSNLKLADYILTSTRKARKEDIQDLIMHIDAQRKDEQLNQSIKFQQLEQAISSKNNIDQRL